MSNATFEGSLTGVSVKRLSKVRSLGGEEDSGT